MKTIWKAALGVMGLGMLAACQPYDARYGGYYGGGGYSDWGYCDDWGCPDGYWDRPLYYGSVYYGGRWNNGPFYYRDWNGSRQFWLQGGWRNDGWRGARPPQYRDGRYGPSLGRDWYRNNRPDRDGRPGYNRGGDNRPGDGRPGMNQGGRGGGRDGARGGGNPGRNQAEIQQNRGRGQGIAPQSAPRNDGGQRPGGRARGLPPQ